MRRFVVVSLVAAVAAYAPSPHCMRTQSTRSQPAHVVMKGKGSRGIPGKATSGRTASGGITDKAKKKFEIDDFNAKSEWTLVAEKDELGAETGSTKAVAAGVARKRVESAVSVVPPPTAWPPGAESPGSAACLRSAWGEQLRRPGPSGVLPCVLDAPPLSPMLRRFHDPGPAGTGVCMDADPRPADEGGPGPAGVVVLRHRWLVPHLPLPNAAG